MGCARGRLRLYQGRVYSNDGYEIVNNKKKGSIYRFGELVDVDEFFEHFFSKSFRMKKDFKKTSKLKRKERTSAVKYEKIKASIRKIKRKIRKNNAKINVDIEDKINEDMMNIFGEKDPFNDKYKKTSESSGKK